MSARKTHACFQSVRDEQHAFTMREVSKYARDHADEIAAEWDALDGRTAAQQARDNWNAMSPERRGELNEEWNG